MIGSRLGMSRTSAVSQLLEYSVLQSADEGIVAVASRVSRKDIEMRSYVRSET